MTRRNILFVSIISLLLQGCNPLMGFRPDSEELVETGWAKQPCKKKTPEPLYCYKTLANVVCHTAPLKDQERLNSFYGPKP